MNSIQTAVLIIQALTQLLPVLIQAVDSAEAALPQSGVGEQKLAMVKGWIQTALAAANTTTVTFDAVWPAVKGTISTVVAIKNSAGEFKK